jgi:hypothetical protein
MRRTVGAVVLGLSAIGYPLTRLAVHRWGIRGVAVTEAASAVLVIRDAAMIAAGVPGRLRPIPAALLYLEPAAGVIAVLTGLPQLKPPSGAQAPPPRPSGVDTVWRAACAILFAAHTIRFAIYLSPDQGRRSTSTDTPLAASSHPAPNGKRLAAPAYGQT